MENLLSQVYPGPIRVSLNRRGFVDAAGKPFFWLGDTAWPLFTSYTREDAALYLADRAQKGFTVIQGVLAWGEPDPVTLLQGPLPSANYAGQRPWMENAAYPNPAFFENVDYVLGLAGNLGLTLAIVPIWGNNIQEDHTVDAAAAFAFGKFLGERYRRAPNIVWMNGGDREPLGYEDSWRALAQGLRNGDGGAHLITYHPCGWRSSSYYFHDVDWLDFNMIETWTDWPRVYPAISADYARLPVKPVVLGEGCYEDGPEYPYGPVTPLVVRRQAWWTFTAGGFYTNGQNQMWRMEPGWRSAIQSPGSFHMSQFKAIASSQPFWAMIPDQTLFASGISSDRTLNTAMRRIDRRGALLYLSSQCHVLLHLDRIATRQVKATWVNPQNGDRKEAGTFATGNASGATFPQHATQWFSVPDFWEDAVLLLDGLDA